MSLKLKFFNRFNRPKQLKCSKTGNGKEPIFKIIKDEKTGRSYRKKVGETNLYLQIQENSKLCGVDLLVAQLKAGDFSSLDASGGLYVDEKDYPKTIFEAKENTEKMLNHYRKSSALKKIYKDFDAYVKALYDNKVVTDLNNFYRDEATAIRKEIEAEMKSNKNLNIDKSISNDKKIEMSENKDISEVK